jgi:cysteine desulfurase/selenocysteine lyase
MSKSAGAFVQPVSLAETFEVERARADFPILAREIHGKPLAYLDNAATTQKPHAVIYTLTDYYTRYNSNVHRGIHKLSEEATWEYEKARGKLKRLIGADDPREIIFTRQATEAINLVAQSFVRPRVGEGDEILVSYMEHHSNIVPWQMVCAKTGAELRVIPINDSGELEMEQLDRLIGPRTRFLSLVHVSNALGTINPVKQVVALAHERGVPVLLDGAQAVQHLSVDVQDLGCDFYAFSGHKMYGPTGIGVLHGRAERLEEMEPYQGGGEMILEVSFEKTTYNKVPYRFEAGTPHICGAIGLGVAAEYLMRLGLDRIHAYEDELLAYGTQVLARIPGLRMIGTAREKSSVLSFTVEGVHPHDLGTILDQEGVAVRAGHHCAQPTMERFGVPATTRASLSFYNTREELDRLAAGIERAIEMLR